MFLKLVYPRNCESHFRFSYKDTVLDPIGMPRPVTRERETTVTLMDAIQRSPSAMDNFSFKNPQKSPTRIIVDYEPPRRSAMTWRGARDLTEFSTPQRVTVMGRERQVIEFRTPQHPIAGTNNWGGASPLLWKNIPKESRETSYLRFNAASALDHDDGNKSRFPARADSRSSMGHATAAARHGRKGGSSEARKGGMLSMLMRWWTRREVKVLGGDKKKSSWPPGGDHCSRWPQGWGG